MFRAPKFYVVERASRRPRLVLQVQRRQRLSQWGDGPASSLTRRRRRLERAHNPLSEKKSSAWFRSTFPSLSTLGNLRSKNLCRIFKNLSAESTTIDGSPLQKRLEEGRPDPYLVFRQARSGSEPTAKTSGREVAREGKNLRGASDLQPCARPLSLRERRASEDETRSFPRTSRLRRSGGLSALNRFRAVLSGVTLWVIRERAGRERPRE